MGKKPSSESTSSVETLINYSNLLLGNEGDGNILNKLFKINKHF